MFGHENILVTDQLDKKPNIIKVDIGIFYITTYGLVRLVRLIVNYKHPHAQTSGAAPKPSSPKTKTSQLYVEQITISVTRFFQHPLVHQSPKANYSLFLLRSIMGCIRYYASSTRGVVKSLEVVKAASEEEDLQGNANSMRVKQIPDPPHSRCEWIDGCRNWSGVFVTVCAAPAGPRGLAVYVDGVLRFISVLGLLCFFEQQVHPTGLGCILSTVGL